MLLGFFSILIVAVTQLSRVPFSEVHQEFIAPPPLIEKFAFGYNESLADFLWIRAIQDFSYCDTYIGTNVCQNNSWLFQVVDAVTNLSPSFRSAYFYGSLALSIILTDKEGARRLYEKGVAAFPNDWQLNYYAAYHYIYEINDKKRAAELLIQAGKFGAPAWVTVLAGRLYSDEGQLEMAERVLQEMKDTKQDPTLIERLEKKIESIKAENSKK